MRYDDRIATVLAQPADRPDRIAAHWRQLVDLLAQGQGDSEETLSRRAFAFLRERRGAVDPALRRRVAETLAGRRVAPDLVACFAEDSPAIAAPLIAGARLTTDEWLALLPRLAPPARALLRHRRDLPAEIVQALAAFGPSDFALEGGIAMAPAAQDRGDSQIRELVARIEAYRRQKEAMPPPPVVPASPAAIDQFRWESTADGTIRWIDGAPRGALIGQTIATIAGPGQYGVDGQAAGAFEKRAPFRDARFRVAGEGSAAGDWRISGVPFFEPARGSFLGYRGTARRPRLDEIASSPAAGGVFGTHFPADALRQLIHELRTPLNAIIGFSEMIEGQYLGPAATSYRGRAADIMSQARRLLSAVDDLDTAARIESHRLDIDDSAVDAAALLNRLHESYARVAAARSARLALDIAPDLPLASVAPAAAERMIARLLAATIGLAREGEEIATALVPAARGERIVLRLSLDRPGAIADIAETELLDPGYSPDGDWPAAPVLGLGFALRLVRNLAEAVGGALDIGAARIALDLPALIEEPADAEGAGGA
ncbi:MAG: HAMP domain-containing histidine kinase [Sphingomonas sp.]|nr:HAMP domain-containing histidine kinase [Sphingomonas sp.]